MTLQLVETVTLASSASSIEFTSIPQDGVDLLLVYSVRSTGVGVLRFNGNSGSSDYSWLELRGTGSAVSSTSDASDTEIQSRGVNPTSSVANTFGNSSVYISNYTSSANKSVSIDSVQEDNDTFAPGYLIAAKYNLTTPITSIEFSGNASDLVAGSTASLYKIF